MNIPKRIEKCPVAEAIIEVRFSTDLPQDAVFGIVYRAIKDNFSMPPVALPIMQIPEAVRLVDPNLKYQASHAFTKDQFSVNVGPRVIAFVCRKPYVGWGQWSKFVGSILKKIEDVKVIRSIERIGLRYVNIFNERDIISNTTVELKINGQTSDMTGAHIRTQFTGEEFVTVTQIANDIAVIIDNVNKIGSLVDIDCMKEHNLEPLRVSDLMDLIESAHNVEREHFYSILKSEFIATLKPVYEE